MHKVFITVAATVVGIYLVHRNVSFNKLMTPTSGEADMFPFVRSA